MKGTESGEGTYESALVKQYKEVSRGHAGNYCASHKPFLLTTKNHINQFACNTCNVSWQDRINQTIRGRV